MPLVQQDQSLIQPPLGNVIFGPGSVEEWASHQRPVEAVPTERTPAAEPATNDQPTIQQRPRTRRRRIAGISLYELIGQTLALLGTLALAGLIWAIGAYFTLRFLDDWGAQTKLQSLLTTFGMTPTPEMLYWMTRSAPVIMTTIEVFLLPRWNWPWTPESELRPSSGSYRWLVFGAVITPDVYTTVAGLSNWVAQVLGLTAGWSTVAAVVLGVAIAISPEKIGRRVLAELKVLWGPIVKRMVHMITRR
ncbi:MAG TPA: hypothetical protein VGD69_30585 [Herpetosiphonaceae bacterium]